MTALAMIAGMTPITPGLGGGGEQTAPLGRTSIVTTTERTFVIRVRDGRAAWVDITRGTPAGDLIEVFGALTPGDEILRRASDEVREGAVIQARRALPR